VTLLPRGRRSLEKVTRRRITELRASGVALVNAIDALLEAGNPLRERSAKLDEKATRLL
jgi:hypothetical protein